MKRSDRPAVEVAAGIGERQRGFGVEPRLALDEHRQSRVRGVAHVGQRQRRRPLAADQQGAVPPGSSKSSSLGVAVSTASTVIGLSPPIVTGRPARSAAIARGSARVAQISSSQISGTWSDGRSQARHGSSTWCAARCGASSGDAHI